MLHSVDFPVLNTQLSWNINSSSQSDIDRLNRATAYSISHPLDVGGVVDLSPPLYPDYPVCLSEPSRAPGRLRAKSVSASEAEVTWKPLAWSNNRRRILGYEVKPTRAHTAGIV